MNMLLIDKCNNYTVLKIVSFIGYILIFIQIIVPLILIVLGTIDLVKALVSNRDNMSKSTKIIAKRFIYGVAIFLIPLLIKFILVLVSNNTEFETCFYALSNPAKGMEQAEIVRGSYSKASDFKDEQSCVASGRKWLFTHSQVENCEEEGCYICVEVAR